MCTRDQNPNKTEKGLYHDHILLRGAFHFSVSLWQEHRPSGKFFKKGNYSDEVRFSLEIEDYLKTQRSINIINPISRSKEKNMILIHTENASDKIHSSLNLSANFLNP